MSRGVTREIVESARRIAEQEQPERVRKNTRDAQPVVDELLAAGINVRELGDLPFARVESKRTYRNAAVPILIRWLPKVENPDIRMGIIDALGVPEARPMAIRPLLEAYEKENCEGRPDFYVKSAIASSLTVVADDSAFHEIARLVRDERHGQCRQNLVWALGNMKHPEAPRVLLDVLTSGDKLIEPWAIRPLGRLRVEAARDRIHRFLDDPEPWVRQEAKRALQKIDRVTRH